MEIVSSLESRYRLSQTGGCVTGLENLDDQDYPAYTTGQAAEMLGVQQAFLRSLDTAAVVRPERSGGGHRRYSRRQLTLVLRLREQLDEGHSLASAARIVGLEDELADAHDIITGLRARLDERDC
ncbi:MerR family transcriptional regulator [Streptomyces sp. AA4]|nr:MerR family transcriptional regulator [Streptomyces sp. AA4]